MIGTSTDPLVVLDDHLRLGLEIGAEAYVSGRGAPRSGFVPGDMGIVIDGLFREGLAAHIVLKFQDEDEVQQRNLVEEGFVRLGDTGTRPYFLDAGRMTMPVCESYTRFSTDTAVQVIGETTEKDGIAVGLETGWLEARATAYAGSVGPKAEQGIQQIDENVFFLGISPTDGLELGGYWTSDLGESDEISSTILDLVEIAIDDEDPPIKPDEVEGWGAFLSQEVGDFELDAEFIGALNHYRAGLLDPRAVSPWAWYGELAWQPGGWEMAARYEEAHETPGSPKRQFGVFASRDLDAYVSVTAEYLHAEYATGIPRRDLVVTGIHVSY